MLSKLVIPAPVQAGWALFKRFWPYIVIAILAGALYLTRDTLEDTKATLTSEVEFREQIAVVFDCPGKDRSAVATCLSAVRQTSENRRETLEEISRQAREAHERSKQADAALKREQEANARKFAAAQRKISDLENRKPGGSTIEEDSKAAWEGWR